jgi:hypothetical protein
MSGQILTTGQRSTLISLPVTCASAVESGDVEGRWHCKINQLSVRCESLMAVIVKSTVFCIVTLYLERVRRFGRTYRPHLQGRTVRQERNEQKQASSLLISCCMPRTSRPSWCNSKQYWITVSTWSNLSWSMSSPFSTLTSGRSIFVLWLALIILHLDLGFSNGPFH